MNRFTRLVAAASLVTVSSLASAAPVSYDVAGSPTSGANPGFAVFNGRLLAGFPRPQDLPLAFTGRLTYDQADGTASFRVRAQFTSPNIAYSFDVPIKDLGPGLVVSGSTITIDDVFADFDFSLVLDTATGQGQWSYTKPNAVPSQPPQASLGAGTITRATLVTQTRPVDLDNDGVVNIDDLFLYFRLFFAGDPRADFLGDGAITIDDLFAYVRAFFDARP